MKSGNHLSRKWLLLLLVPVYLGLLAAVNHQVRNSIHTSVTQNGLQQLDLLRTYLNGELDKYEFLPELLSTNVRIKEFLRRPQEKVRTASVNRYLETINGIAGSADTYLMDSSGLTLAASNWQKETSFVGKRFDYRPYFRDAMQGMQGRYYALGTTSGKRGYYFSFPVRDGDQIIGAVVMKIDIGHIESTWQHQDSVLIISDNDGVIFMASERSWLYQTLQPLSDQRVREIHASSRYPGVKLAPWSGGSIEPRLVKEVQHAGLTLAKSDQRAGEYLAQSLYMPEAGWHIHLLSSLSRVQQQSYLAGILATIAFGAFLLLGMFLQQRRRRLQDQARFEERAQQTLREAHDQLEQRVQERTSDLQREIEVRRQAEEELRQTQNELIQTAKLAVLGQMSTGISHELNQPLAAIRAYADNARLLLEKERTDDVRNNLHRIGTLVDRMAQISMQLKQFSRKTSGQCVNVSLAEAMEASLRILQPKMKRTSMVVDNQISDSTFRVYADPVQLEQILVNLVNNAINACQDISEPVISVAAKSLNGRLRVAVRDNGHGIKTDNIEQIFEPFFTTRESGLGLGLSISRRIARSMEGELTARNHPDGGAEFFLDLKQVN